jgi:uncharacterized YkwD family protein
VKNSRFLTTLAIAGALIITSPLNTFAAGKQQVEAETQQSLFAYSNVIQETIQCLNLDSLLKQYGYSLDWKQEQPTAQPKPSAPTAPTKEQPTSTQTVKQVSKQQQQKTSYSLSKYEQQVVDLTNKERAKYGLPPLKVSPELSKMARVKAQDMHNQHYFDHISPTYGSPFDMMQQFGIQFRAAGENIAMGQPTPKEVVNDWMHSQGHRRNILSKDFNYIGVGYVKDGNYWTQEFIGK